MTVVSVFPSGPGWAGPPAGGSDHLKPQDVVMFNERVVRWSDPICNVAEIREVTTTRIESIDSVLNSETLRIGSDHRTTPSRNRQTGTAFRWSDLRTGGPTTPDHLSEVTQ
jgi:hypothetical protein